MPWGGACSALEAASPPELHEVALDLGSPERGGLGGGWFPPGGNRVRQGFDVRRRQIVCVEVEASGRSVAGLGGELSGVTRQTLGRDDAREDIVRERRCVGAGVARWIPTAAEARFEREGEEIAGGAKGAQAWSA